MEQKNKGFNLGQFKVEPDSDLTDRDGIKYALTSQIPMETTDKMLDIKTREDMSDEEKMEFAKEDKALMKQIVREILLVKNEEKKVDALMKKLSHEDFIHVVDFILDWIKEIKQSKQKKS